jgi:hypothetical protein
MTFHLPKPTELSDKDQVARLVLTVEALQAQMQEQARLAKEQVSVMSA